MKTKHLTIMFTDIKGFTSKTSKSSREQLHQLLELHDKLILPIFKDFGGKVIKTIGDAFMVSFHSPTDALLCGIKIQNILAKHNEKVPPKDQLEVRIAINSGEVTIKENDVFGEAVNIASRLEGIADAGDIYFTESVYLAMNKSEIPTAEVGHRHFKGIPEEIKVYKVLQEGAKRKGVFKKEKPVKREYIPKKKKILKILKWVAIVFVILVIISKCSENKEQEQEKERFEQHEIEKEFQKDQLRQEIEHIAMETRKAIEEGDERRAQKGIDALHEFNEKLNHPPELEDEIHDIKIFYDEVFGIPDEK
jgi:class 3 adenylate cyclase